jgi:hypothetical protein
MVPVLVLVCAATTVGMHRLARDRTNALTLIMCSCSKKVPSVNRSAASGVAGRAGVETEDEPAEADF